MKFNVNLRFVRYFLIIFSVIIFTYTIQIFVQNFNIEKEITELKQEQIQLSGDTYWKKEYYEPFLKTNYATIVFKHKSGVIDDDEILVKILSDKEEIEKTIKKVHIYNNENNMKCKDFFQQLYDKYLSL